MSERWLIIYADGLCEPNPGGVATYGWWAQAWDQDDYGAKKVARGYGLVATGPAATNNLAEYTAVLEALVWALGKRERLAAAGYQVLIRTDSQLVAKQLLGEWQCTSSTLQRLYSECVLLMGQLGASIEWVPREQNQYADNLSRTAFAEVHVGRLEVAA